MLSVYAAENAQSFQWTIDLGWFLLWRGLRARVRDFHVCLLEQHGQQAEDGHVEAERGDRRMAEQARKADEMQDRAEQQEYRQRSHGVADKGRQQNTADRQLVESMSHRASLCSPSRIMPARSNSLRASPSCVAGAPHAAIWPMRTASRNIASSGAQRASLDDGRRSSSPRVASIIQ